MTISWPADEETISLVGGTGADILAGGEGSDSFFFDTAPTTTTDFNQIFEFSATDDTVLLDRAVCADAGRLPGGLRLPHRP